MFPRHSRAHPFVMRIRSFALTRSISSFQRLTDTSVPSSSTAFASQTLPVEPDRLEKSRTVPFSRIVSSITSTLLSGRTSLTFIGMGANARVSLKDFRLTAPQSRRDTARRMRPGAEGDAEPQLVYQITTETWPRMTGGQIGFHRRAPYSRTRLSSFLRSIQFGA